mgnify:CR=1 FL=1
MLTPHHTTPHHNPPPRYGYHNDLNTDEDHYRLWCESVVDPDPRWCVVCGVWCVVCGVCLSNPLSCRFQSSNPNHEP